MGFSGGCGKETKKRAMPLTQLTKVSREPCLAHTMLAVGAGLAHAASAAGSHCRRRRRMVRAVVVRR